MITVTATQYAQNPAKVHELAKGEPVLVATGDTKQVLIDYEQYKQLAHTDTDKPFVSLYDALVTNMPDDLREALSQIDDDDDEPDDLSYARRLREQG